MEVFNKTPAIAEDTLQYAIYPPTNMTDKTSATTLAACIHTFVDGLLSNKFIWHRDAFEVKVVPNSDNNDWILEGRMRVGDSVDDEWASVWLLKEISSKWDVTISVFDSDGDFLLIEAAMSLPSWVKPTNSENRVWIYNSRVHLIPLSHVSPLSRQRRRKKLPGFGDSDDEDVDAENFLAANDGSKLVRDPSINTFGPIDVEKAIWGRIEGYPEALKGHMHKTKAYIPSAIAKALAVNPHLVQKAVEAFYTRDSIQLRAAHRMMRFPPETSILIPVKMTRTAYAQLVGQKFFPPKVFGVWQEREGTKERRWRDVGMKIAVGFEMLFQENKLRSHNTTSSTEGITLSAEANKEALRRNPEYQVYIKNLQSINFFEGQLEGSELWNKLANKAASIFLQVREPDAARHSFAFQVAASISEAKSIPDFGGSEEDSDEWLNIDAQDFENMLESTMKNRSHSEDDMNVENDRDKETIADKVASGQAERLKDLAVKVEHFVEREGDLEGARFDDEHDSDSDDLSDERFSEDESSGSDSVQEIDLTKRQTDTDNLVSGIRPSEYGQMPASFHANSQKTASSAVAHDISEVNKYKEKKSDGKIEEHSQHRSAREPIILRDKYDGVDSDDEIDEEDAMDDDEEEEDRPLVVGEIEIDMEQEEEEFLEFSRQALGISDSQWDEIVQDRKQRGAFLPASAFLKSTPAGFHGAKYDSVKSPRKSPESRIPGSGPPLNVNPNLDSFEEVMRAMDEELARVHGKNTSKPPASSCKADINKNKASLAEDDDKVDIEVAMEAELRAALEKGDEDDDEEGSSGELMDYNLIKNFLESFKSQAGLSGPVSNLAGRLQPGWKLPRDES